VVLTGKSKDRIILTYKGVNNQLNFNELNLRKIKTKWLYYSSLLGESFKTQERLAEILTKKGVKLAFNPSSYLIKEKNLSKILKITDILVLNKSEAQMLTKNKDLLLGLHELGPKTVVITDKNNPISCFDGNNKYYLKPHKIKVVERTGAGDAFASGFTAAQIAGRTIQESLELGLREGESVLRHFGAKNNLLRMKLG